MTNGIIHLIITSTADCIDKLSCHVAHSARFIRCTVQMYNMQMHNIICAIDYNYVHINEYAQYTRLGELSQF
jgi:hypothetical protein